MKTLCAKQVVIIAVLMAIQVGSNWFMFGGANRLGQGARFEAISTSMFVIAGLGLTGYCIALLLKYFRNARPTEKYRVNFFFECVLLTLGSLVGLAPLWLGIWFGLVILANR